MLKKENGLTLVEVVMALTIFTAIVGLAWGVLIKSIDNSNKLQLQTHLQQEAHTFLNTLSKIHRDIDEEENVLLDYTITLDQSPKANIVTIFNEKNSYEFSNPNYSYTLLNFDDSYFGISTQITPTNSLQIKVLVEDKNSNLNAEVSTIISR